MTKSANVDDQIRKQQWRIAKGGAVERASKVELMRVGCAELKTMPTGSTDTRPVAMKAPAWGAAGASSDWWPLVQCA